MEEKKELGAGAKVKVIDGTNHYSIHLIYLKGPIYFHFEYRVENCQVFKLMHETKCNIQYEFLMSSTRRDVAPGRF